MDDYTIRAGRDWRDAASRDRRARPGQRADTTFRKSSRRPAALAVIGSGVGMGSPPGDGLAHRLQARRADMSTVQGLFGGYPHAHQL